MAGYYSYVIVTLLLIYSNLTDAYRSTYNGSKSDVMNHLIHEKQTPSSWRNTDWVCEQNEYGRKVLCDEVLSHLIREENRDVLQTLLDGNGLAQPDIAKRGPALACRGVTVDGLGTMIPMYWCLPRRYKKVIVPGSSSASNIGQIAGFFCAGSLENIDRVYVFRTENATAGTVKPVAELNNCSGWQDFNPGTESRVEEDLGKYRSGFDRV